MQNITFLLGAGAVFDVGLPMAVGLQDMFDADIANTYPSLLPALRFIKGAIQFGKACHPSNLTTPAPVNIEELLIACTFLSAKDSSYIYPFVSSWHEKIQQFQSLPSDISSDEPIDSFEFLGRHCKKKLYEWLTIKEEHRVKYFRSFKDFIDADFRLQIFTLNYDECIETALTGAIGNVNEKWTTGFDENGWNPALFDEDFSAYYYKLHGSLFWVNDPRLGICSVKWPQAKDAEEITDYSPLLIFGDNNKLQSVDPYLTLLYQFQRILNLSPILVICGYSFADKHINDMILQALQRDTQMRCIVAQPHKGDLKDLLPPSFDRYASVEDRFVHLNFGAKIAFDDDKILPKVKEILKANEDELLFV